MKHLRTIAIGLVMAAAAGAQAPAGRAPVASPEATALRTCTALADAGKGDQAEEPGQFAASVYMKRLTQNPRDFEALVGAARAKSQCLVPAANFLTQGELSTEAMELLDQALEIQPDHWLARFVLASIAYRSPAFLGRGKRAAKEFDELLRLQGNRTDDPMFARVFALRGLQLSKQGQVDSARALWARGAALFPDDAELRKLSQPAPKTSPPTRDSAASSATTQLSAVRVTAAIAPPPPRVPSVREVARSQVLTTAGGAADVLQAVQMQPGATRVGEGGDVYTRGGDPGETSLVVNGGRILSLARFEGLSGSMFGAIEPFIVKSVRYSSGGFSAQHGNALSGVLEIETDGRPRERQSRAGLSLVQVSGTVRTPISKKVGAWVSGRLSHTGALLETHGRTDEFSAAPRSQEMIASVIAAPTPFSELRATAIVEHDDSRRNMNAAGWSGSFNSSGGLRAAMLSSRWMSSAAPVIVRANLTGSSRSTAWGFGVLSRDRRETETGARIDAEWEARSWMTLRTGVEQRAQSRTESGSVPTTPSVAIGSPTRVLDAARVTANQLGGYGESEMSVGSMLITTGVRMDRLPGEADVTFDPRLAISRRSGAWTTRLSGGVFHQGRSRGESAIPDAGTPSGLPRTAQHLVFGTEREERGNLFRVETYLKRYADYKAFGDGPAIVSALARGVDVIGQHSSGPITGWLGYSLLDATSRLADGAEARAAFDVTHSATGSVTAALNSDWSVGTTVRYGSGAPRTPITGAHPTAGARTEPTFGALMSETLPSYARTDARVMRYFRMPTVLLTTFVEVLNVTNRANVSTYTYDPTYTSREAVRTFFSKRTFVMGGELMFR